METNPHTLEQLAALLVAVLSAVAVGLKFLFRFIDQKWPPPKNGADERRVCFMGQGAGDQIIDKIDTHHSMMRDMIHQNHAAALTILDRIASVQERQQTTQAEMAITLRILAERLDRIDRRLDA